MNAIAGTEKQLINLINKLNPDRFETHLFCLRESSAEFSKTPLNTVYSNIGIKTIFSLRSMIKVFAVAHILRKYKIDIVHTFFIDANIIGIACAKLAGIKAIVSSRRDLGFWHTKRLLALLKVLNRQCKSFYVNSKAVKHFIMEKEAISEDKIEVIYNGIDLKNFELSNEKKTETITQCFAKRNFNIVGEEIADRFNDAETCIDEKEFIVGIAANFSRRVKRIDVFIEAAKRVLAQIPNVTFVIVGGGYLYNELHALSERLGIKHKIVFTGVRNDIPQILSQWDIGTLSSDSEGLSNAIIEYMASGLPVVATKVGGNCELIESGVNGFLVPPGQPGPFAESIISLLRNEELRVEMGKTNREKAQKMFLWDNVIQKTEAYYQALLTG